MDHEKPSVTELQHASLPDALEADVRPVPGVHAKTIILVIVGS